MPSPYFRKKQTLEAGREWPVGLRTGTGGNRPAPAAATETPALDAIRTAETAIRHALRELEHERDTLMRKVKELDDAINKYKHFTGGAA